MKDIYIGIDPGAKGAIAILKCSRRNVFAQVWDYDDLDGFAQLTWYAKEMTKNHFVLRTYLEKQQVFPKQGAVSGFKLGVNYGIWQGRFETLQIPYEFIMPRKWRNAIFDSMPRKEDKKAMSLDMARRLFPELREELKLKKHDGRAEALLIAELCRRNNA